MKTIYSYAVKWHKKWAIFCFSLVLIFAQSCSYSTSKTRALFEKAKDNSYDMVIVPGVPFEGEEWSDIMKIRVFWSKYLFDKGIAKNIMFSGSAVYSPYFEAEIMALYAEKIGIPKANIFVETKAEHSTENVYYSYKKSKLLGFSSVALATDPFQSKMVKSFIRAKLNNEVTVIPIVFDTLRQIESQIFTPKINYELAFDDAFISIMEREGFWKRLNGTRGKNLDPNAYENLNQTVTAD